MKKLIFMFLPFLFISCFTTKSISNDNLYDASKSTAKLEVYAEQLSAQSNIDKQLNLKEDAILKSTDNLLDELEYSIEYEKNEIYNSGVKYGFSEGYKQALIDMVEKSKEENNEN